MKLLFRLLCVLALAGAGGAIGYATARWVSGDRRLSQDTVPMLMQIRQMSELTTLHIEVGDVRVTRLDGKLGGVSALLVVHGDVEMRTDLSQGYFEQVDRASRTAVLVLPPPRPSAPRLDHSRTTIFAITSHGLWTVAPASAVHARIVQLSYAEAEAAIARAPVLPEMTARSKSQTETMIRSIFEPLGWRVHVRWR